jgi:PPP family 3-phenylpropionic acid transporter
MLIVSQQTVFLWIAVLIGLNEFATAGADPLSTVLALKPDQGGEASGFGSIRLWGSLGWAIVVFASGWIIERTGIFSAFVGYGLAMGASILLLGVLGSRKKLHARPLPTTSLNIKPLVVQLLRSRVLLGLGAALMVSWFSRLGVGQFEPLFMESLGAGETIIGLASSLGAVVELPAMLWADQLIKKFGARRLLQLTFGLYALMALGVLLIPAVATIFVARLIGGLAFSLVTVSLVVYLNNNAPLGQSATMLALYTITLRNLVTVITAPIGGQIYDAVGAYWLYVLAFAGSLLSLAILTMTQHTNHT